MRTGQGMTHHSCILHFRGAEGWGQKPHRAVELFLSSFCCLFPFALRNWSGQTGQGKEEHNLLYGQGSAALTAKGILSIIQFQPSK